MLSDDEITCLGDRIAERSRVADAGSHHLLADVRHFDAMRGWDQFGQLSCAHWLSWRCGIGLAAAREKVRVARALGNLPKTETALREGFLSYSKLRAITRLATPETEEEFLEAARQKTGAEFERHCRIRAQQNPPGRIEPDRWVRVRDTPLGMVRLGAMLRAEEAGRLIEAIEAAAKTRADGLVAIAEEFLRGNQPTRPPTEVVVHINAATMTGSQEGVGIPTEVCQRLLCDADIVPIVQDESGNPIEVGKKKPRFSAEFRQALAARDNCCRFPGCTRTKLLDGHYVRHWLDGGQTTMENVLLLCLTHHKRVHDKRFSIVEQGGNFRFFTASGIEVRVNGDEWTLPLGKGAPPGIISSKRLDGEGGALAS